MIMLMGFQGIFPMNKHEVLSNFVRFGIYFNRKLCLKFVLENIDIGHLKISRDYSWPQNFQKRNGQYIYYTFVYTFENVVIC